MPRSTLLQPGAARALIGAAAFVLAACATVPDDDRLLALRPDGQVAAVTQPCGPSRARQAPVAAAVGTAGTLDPGALRVLSWNIHKAEDEGWQVDLARYASQNDLVLLQEAVLNPPMRDVLEREGYSWRMVGAFAFNGVERGVLNASRVAPSDGCALRSYEPVTYLPKSAIVSRYPLAGRSDELAVANLHGINFSLGLGRFREQLEAVADEISRHDGPVVFGGDFNTWSQARHEVLGEVAARLKLVPVELVPDGRRRAFGKHLDHLFVRGFSVVEAHAPEVKSSDHNPILVRLAAPRP